MHVYIVGGAVRDTLLGLKPEDIDWLVVGATINDIHDMEERGMKQVGNDFPVYLHPETGEEYALARIERKIGAGYNGFTCETQGVTLEDDLLRRDLTINAMAMDPKTKEIFDPYNGKQDLEDMLIRHVSSAFSEDPVRILRVARFAARYKFDVAGETMSLMQDMVANGEVNALTRERVMQEFTKVVDECDAPSIFVEVLRECGALDVIFPEVKVHFPEELTAMDLVVETAAQDDRFSAFMSVFLMNVDSNKWDQMQARVVMPSAVFRFAKAVSLNGTRIAQLTRTEAEEVVRVLSLLNIRNNGGEAYLQRICNIMCMLGDMNEYEQDQVMKLYDMFNSVDIVAEIERMLKAGTPLVGKEIRLRQEAMQTEAIAPYFS